MPQDLQNSQRFHVMRPQHHHAMLTFALGGISCQSAALVTNGVDVIKTRMQLHGEGAKSISSRGIVATFGHVIRSEGFLALYQGIVPSLLREGSYSTIRMGLYEPIKRAFGVDQPGQSYTTNAIKKISAGAVAGGIGAVIANPTDLVKVRMQAGQGGSHQYNDTIGAFRTIVRHEGISGLWKGWWPTTQRACLLTGTQIPTYDMVKRALLKNDVLSEGRPLHFMSSFAAGFACACTTAPTDNIKTRLMSQPVDASGKGLLYASTADCFKKTFVAEGFKGLYKGFWMQWLRIGPHTVVTFIVFEKLRQWAGLQPV